MSSGPPTDDSMSGTSPTDPACAAVDKEGASVECATPVVGPGTASTESSGVTPIDDPARDISSEDLSPSSETPSVLEADNPNPAAQATPLDPTRGEMDEPLVLAASSTATSDSRAGDEMSASEGNTPSESAGEDDATSNVIVEAKSTLESTPTLTDSSVSEPEEVSSGGAGAVSDVSSALDAGAERASEESSVASPPSPSSTRSPPSPPPRFSSLDALHPTSPVTPNPALSMYHARPRPPRKGILKPPTTTQHASRFAFLQSLNTRLSYATSNLTANLGAGAAPSGGELRTSLHQVSDTFKTDGAGMAATLAMETAAAVAGGMWGAFRKAAAPEAPAIRFADESFVPAADKSPATVATASAAAHGAGEPAPGPDAAAALRRTAATPALRVRDLRTVRFRMDTIKIVYPINAPENAVAPYAERQTRRRINTQFVDAVRRHSSRRGWSGNELWRVYYECSRTKEERTAAPVQAFFVDKKRPPRTLDVAGFRFSRGQIEALSDLLSIDFGLRKLVLENCALTDESLKYLLNALLISRTVAHVGLAKNTKIQAEGWRYIAIFLHRANFVRFFDASGVYMDKKGAEFFVQGLMLAKLSSDAYATGGVQKRQQNGVSDGVASEPSTGEGGEATATAGAQDSLSPDAPSPALASQDAHPETEESALEVESHADAGSSGNNTEASLDASRSASPSTSPTGTQAPTPNDPKPNTSISITSPDPNLAPPSIEDTETKAASLSADTEGPPVPDKVLPEETEEDEEGDAADYLFRHAPLLQEAADVKPDFVDSIRLDGCGIRGPTLGVLARAVREAPLKHLSLRQNKINTNHAVALSLIIKDYNDPPPSPARSSEEAENEANKVTTLHEHKLKMRKQIDTMPHFGSLVTLDLKNNDLRNGVIYLGQVLGKNRTLKVLNIGDNKIDPVTLAQFSKSLSYNTVLETLDLSGNPCCGPELEGIMGLRSVIALEHTSLKRLLLRNTGLASEGAISLAEFLPEAHSLVHIDISNNFNIDISGVWALSASIKSNYKIRCLDLDIPPNSPDFSALSQQIAHYCIRNTELSEKEQTSRKKPQDDKDEKLEVTENENEQVLDEGYSTLSRLMVEDAVKQLAVGGKVQASQAVIDNLFKVRLAEAQLHVSGDASKYTELIERAEAMYAFGPCQSDTKPLRIETSHLSVDSNGSPNPESSPLAKSRSFTMEEGEVFRKGTVLGSAEDAELHEVSGEELKKEILETPVQRSPRVSNEDTFSFFNADDELAVDA